MEIKLYLVHYLTKMNFSGLWWRQFENTDFIHNQPGQYISQFSKGQLISERNFGVFKSPKKRTNSWWIFALVSKMGKIKRIYALYWFEDTKIPFWD